LGANRDPKPPFDSESWQTAYHHKLSFFTDWRRLIAIGTTARGQEHAIDGVEREISRHVAGTRSQPRFPLGESGFDASQQHVIKLHR
jgi:hypothetical protein